MAKLSAHGTELARMTRHDPDTESFTGNRVVYSFRSDGHILTCMKGKHTSQYASERVHDWGWKLWKRVKSGVDRDKAFATMILRRLSGGTTSPGSRFELDHASEPIQTAMDAQDDTTALQNEG